MRGARQVGKSYLIREWATRRFEDVVELNLERDPAVAACFSDNDPRATLRRLESVARTRIRPGPSTLLFLDEIQAAPEVLAKLRWFAEELPDLPVIAAGSLLDFALCEPTFSMPVGRVSFMHLEPLGFREFLDALGEGLLARTLAEDLTYEGIRAARGGLGPVHDRLMDLFSQYLLVGGMPAAVAAYRRDRSLIAAAEVQADLLAALRSDFAKYAARAHHGRLNAVLASAAQQLGGKFTYRHVDPDERGAAMKTAVKLLCLARVCHRVTATAATGVPLLAGADERRFKLIFVDAGLLSAQLGLSQVGLHTGTDLMLAHRGALAEQAVGQLLRLGFRAHDEPALYYWHREARGAEAEVDYVTQQGPAVVPVEVKAGTTGALRSLHLFMAARGFPLAVRFYGDRPSMTELNLPQAAARPTCRLLSLPLYAVEEMPRLVAQALS